MDESLYLPTQEREQEILGRRRKIEDETNRATKMSSSLSSTRKTSLVVKISILSAAFMTIAQRNLLGSVGHSSRALTSLEEEASLPKIQPSAKPKASASIRKHTARNANEFHQFQRQPLIPVKIKSLTNHEEATGGHKQPNLVIRNDKADSHPHVASEIDEEKGSECIFRHSPLYRSIYVYPSPLDKEWKGEILSQYAISYQNITWPWLEMDRRLKKEGKAQYDANNKDFNQYTTELLVRDIITHPDSCLRTNDPESASLFYVPYLPTMEYHNGSLFGDYSTSPFSQAMLDATDFYINEDGNSYGKYDLWEKTFGLTSKYWKRKNGADHIVVMSEPLHGFSHPRNRRGNFHYLHSQKQLSPPIVISIELSTTFVEMYPKCSRKNILMPYPNTDGKWFSGAYNQQTQELWEKLQVPNISESPAALKAEMAMLNSSYISDSDWLSEPRPLTQFYGAGNHGSCKALRLRLGINYRCTESGKLTNRFSRQIKYQHGYRRATFCPCPGGDSPSAKRHFDALHAGCIPVILSHDFVWPFTGEFDKNADGSSTMRERQGITSLLERSSALNPPDFSLRLNASDFLGRTYDFQCQKLLSPSNSSVFVPPNDLQSFLETIPSSEIQRLRKGALDASDLYSYYKRRPDLPENPLREGILPDGGAAHMLVQMLSERANGRLWAACEKEQQEQAPFVDRVLSFMC